MYEDLSKPTTYQKEIKLYSGTSNPKLAQDIADILHLKLQGLKIEKFANGESMPVLRSPSAATRSSSSRPSPART